MLLFSFNYFVFFLGVFILYNLINNNYKTYVLFVASILFITVISVKGAIFALIFTTLNYFFGLFLNRFRSRPLLKNKIFWLSIVLDVGFLMFFKYADSFIGWINTFLSLTTDSFNLLKSNIFFPIGVSYFTFQSIAYLIRIDRGNERAEKNFIRFATLLLFFPKFLSGPIERSYHFLPQIKNPISFDRESVSQGLRLFIMGAFKKAIIANNLYEPVTMIYNNIHSYTGFTLIWVLFVQTIYIYMEFSGYTDMALGSAKMLGIDLIGNFKRPFLAKSVTEYWKRWHISLTSWCNDFIFYPFIFKFRKWGAIATVMGVFLTFLVIGIWHGSKWTFVILGLIQAIAIIFEFYTKRIRLHIGSKLPECLVNIVSRIAVFIFASFSMVFFFSNSLADASYFITHLFSDIKFVLVGERETYFALAFFILFFIAEILTEKGVNLTLLYYKQPKWFRWLGYYIFIMLIYLLNSEVDTFVYMKF